MTNTESYLKSCVFSSFVSCGWPEGSPNVELWSGCGPQNKKKPCLHGQRTRKGGSYYLKNVKKISWAFFLFFPSLCTVRRRISMTEPLQWNGHLDPKRKTSLWPEVPRKVVLECKEYKRWIFINFLPGNRRMVKTPKKKKNPSFLGREPRIGGPLNMESEGKSKKRVKWGNPPILCMNQHESQSFPGAHAWYGHRATQKWPINWKEKRKLS